jgi:translocation and assembly module TamA
MRLSLRHALIVLVCAAFQPTLAWAANPQPYKVEFVSTGQSDMDSTLKATSQLQALRTSAPVDPYGLIARARGDIERLKTVLESFGYYDGVVSITIEGLGLDDAKLGDAVSAIPKGTDAKLRVSYQLGPLFHIGKVELEGTITDADRAQFHLAPGSPAVASEVLAAGARLQSALQNEGYAFAKLDPPVAYEVPADKVLNVTYHVDSGPRVNVGEIAIRGLKRVHESLVRRRLLLHTGEPYSAAAVEKARLDLLTLNVFLTVSVRLGEAPDSLGRVPVTFEVRERPRHTFGINGGYSSDLGGSGGISWGDRNVLGNAEALNLSAKIINLGGTATNGTGYDTSAKYALPDFGHRDQSLQFSITGLKQSLQAYDQTAQTIAVTLSRKLSTVWTTSVGVSAERETIIQVEDVAVAPPVAVGSENPTCVPSIPGEELSNTCEIPVTRDYESFTLPINVSYDSTDLPTPLEDPTHGMRISFNLAPTYSLGGKASLPVADIPAGRTASLPYCSNPSEPLTRDEGTLPLGHCAALYVITQASAATYFDLHGLTGAADGRSVLAVRAMAGTAHGASWYDLPPDQRLYAGGSGTVRGYRYQTVGPEFSDGNPQGGTSMDAINVEYRQRFGTNFGAAFFADGGGVNLSPNPFGGVFRVGIGAGMRYYTPIGPIRVDFAVPTNRRYNDDHFEVYIGLGQAF